MPDRQTRSPRAESAAELKRVIEAERKLEPFLLYRDDAGVHRMLPLAATSPPLTIGRQPSNDIVLDWDAEVSRTHATLEPAGGEWTIADDGLSSNGTYVNGSRLRSRTRLRDGDTIRCGQTSLIYRQPTDQVSELTAPSADGPTRDALTDAQRRVLVALCRPFGSGATYASPAGNQQIADELFLTVDAVKTHLRMLFQKLGLQDLPRSEKRMRLVEQAFEWGLVSESDLR